MKLSELYWHRYTPLHILLWPLSILFRIFILLQKLCYWLDIFHTVKLPVPVIVVDSITTTDGGKTPLILWLVDLLQAHGLRPGIITRGYSDNPGTPTAVTGASDPTVIGGKITLLAKRCGSSCPVWVGDDRAAVAQALLHTNPTCNVIICNDGLQYPRLERNIEIVVVDFSEHSFGNGLTLPAGPLRESLDRFENVDAIVTNGKRMEHIDNSDWAPTYNMKLVSETIYNLSDSSNCRLASDLKDKRLYAIADFNNSQEFFNYIQLAGLNAELHSFAENHHFVQQDFHFPDAEAILMPEENAIQCSEFTDSKLWALPVEAWVDNELKALVLRKLRGQMTDENALNDVTTRPHKKIVE